MDPTTIRFPARWIDASTLEQILLNGPSPFSSSSPEVHFHIPSKCSLMTDAAVRLLSLLNQLDSTTRRVVVHFEGGKHGVLAYLERIGFFQALAANVTVRPKRPTGIAAMRYQGRNPHVVEIHRIYQHQRENDLPNRLTTAITLACEKRRDVRELEEAAWTILAELIDNVFSHSETRLDGFAALQVYPKGNCVKVAVSDSGIGMLETLRPALRVESPKLAALSDVDLIVEVFRQRLVSAWLDSWLWVKGMRRQSREVWSFTRCSTAAIKGPFGSWQTRLHAKPRILLSSSASNLGNPYLLHF